MKKKGKTFVKENKNKLDLRLLLVCIICVFIFAFIGSIFTSKNTTSDWYLTNKSSITPPNYVFPIIWNILYFLIAISLYTLLKSKTKEKTKILTVFIINLVFNALWSYLFFSLKNPLFALIDLILIIITLLLMIHMSYKINKKSSYLLVPYLIWICFAGILNYLFI